MLRKANRSELKLERLCERLREESEDSSVAIVVEGRKDVDALAQLGIKAVCINKKLKNQVNSLKVEKKIVILLFDTDKAGEELLKQWKVNLQRAGFQIQDRYWKILRSLHISHVEGLPRHLTKVVKEYDL